MFLTTPDPEAAVVTVPLVCETSPVVAIVTVSVEESPVTVTPVPAEIVKVSDELSATGLVPDVVAIVVKAFGDAPVGPVGPI
jgi:hypothetical protein